MVLITSTQINSQTPANVHFFRFFLSLSPSLFEQHERQPICFIYLNIHGVIVIVVAVDDCGNNSTDDDDDYVIVHCSQFHSAFDEKYIYKNKINFYGI